MPDVAVNGVRFYDGEHGTGDPILCIHGTSGSAMTWVGASDALSELGRVILYDRCGSARSERPDPDTSSVAQQAEDAVALLAALDVSPAVVIGRSYGGAVALQLALRQPSRLRALILLEAPVFGLDPAVDAYDDDLLQAVAGVAAKDGTLVARGVPAPRPRRCGVGVVFGGGHVIDPAGPEVLRRIATVLAGQQSTPDATGSAVRTP